MNKWRKFPLSGLVHSNPESRQIPGLGAASQRGHWDGRVIRAGQGPKEMVAEKVKDLHVLGVSWKDLVSPTVECCP